jgi:hypothetical protein
MSPQGAAMSEGSSGESISHFAAIRIRLVGTGSLLMKVYSLDDVRSKTLVPLVMSPTNRIIPTRLVNFTEQRASFEFKTTGIDEKFRINRIVVFSKPIFTSYPGS